MVAGRGCSGKLVGSFLKGASTAFSMWNYDPANPFVFEDTKVKEAEAQEALADPKAESNLNPYSLNP